MQIIDRYLVRQFARTFFMTFVCLFGIFVVAEFVTNLAEFMRYRDATENFQAAVVVYYAARIPLFFELSGGIVALLSSVFVIATMQRYQELTALQAAGISRWRLVKPLVVCTAAVAILGVVNREFGLPRVRDQLLSNIRDLTSHGQHTLAARYDHSTDILYDGDGIHVDEGAIIEPRLRLPFNWASVGTTISAATATFQPATERLPSGYLLHEVREPLTNVPSVIAGDNPILLSPTDTSWLEADQCFVVSSLQPIQLRGNYRWQQYGSTLQLLTNIREASSYRSDGLRVTLHGRFVRPFLDMTMLFLGLPIALATQRRHVVFGAAKSLAMVAIISLIILGCQALGIQGMIRPELAAWLPLMILVPVAVLTSGPIVG